MSIAAQDRARPVAVDCDAACEGLGHARDTSDMYVQYCRSGPLPAPNQVPARTEGWSRPSRTLSFRPGEGYATPLLPATPRSEPNFRDDAAQCRLVLRRGATYSGAASTSQQPLSPIPHGSVFRIALLEAGQGEAVPPVPRVCHPCHDTLCTLALHPTITSRASL